MYNKTQTTKSIQNLIRAGTPLIWIQTDEIQRGIQITHQALTEFNKAQSKNNTYTIIEYEPEAGAYIYDWKHENDEKIKNKPANLFEKVNLQTGTITLTNKPTGTAELLQGIHKNTEPRTLLIVALGHAHINLCYTDAHLAEQTNMLLYKMAETTIHNNNKGMTEDEKDEAKLSQKNVTVIFVGPEPKNETLQTYAKNVISSLKLSRPTIDEIQVWIQSEMELMAENRPERITNSLKNFNTDNHEVLYKKAATCLMGLSMFQIENAIYQSIATDNALSPFKLAETKRDLINNTPGLTYRDYDPLFDMDRVKGLDIAQEIIDKLMSQNLPPEDRARSFLLIGSPGTGKTMLGRAFAQKLQIPFISLELDKMLQGLVGESEHNLHQALDIIDTLGPCVVFIDEADKQLAGTSGENAHNGGSDLTQRLGAILLRWEQDRKSQAIIFKAANRIHNFSSEMLRRCNIIIHVDLPHECVRQAILEQYLNDRKIELDKGTILNIVKRTRYWSGDEIKNLVIKMQAFGTKPEELETSFKYIKPVAITKKDDIISIRKQCKLAGVPASEWNVDDEDNDIVEMLENLKTDRPE